MSPVDTKAILATNPTPYIPATCGDLSTCRKLSTGNCAACGRSGRVAAGQVTFDRRPRPRAGGVVPQEDHPDAERVPGGAGSDASQRRQHPGQFQPVGG